MRIIAVIPAWNARPRLAEALAGLMDQVAGAVVVDNGSTDGSAAWLADEWPAVTVIANAANEGFAMAANQGIRRALDMGAEAVLLVNDDAVFQPGAVAALADVMAAEPLVGAATAKMLYRARPEVLNGTGGCYDPRRAWAALRGEGERDQGQYDDRPDVDYPSGGASLLRREALAKVGLFDAAFYLYFEDVDWGLRARRAGWRTRYVPTARVLHAGSTGTASNPARRRYYNVRNRLRFAARWAPPVGRRHAWLATLVLLARQPVRWLTGWRRRDAEAIWWAVLDHLGGRYGRSARYG